MIGKPFRVDWHPDDTPEALKAASRAEQDAMLRTRLHGLWLLWSGRQLGEMSSVVGVHYRTVQERELTEGVEGGRFRTAGEIRD